MTDHDGPRWRGGGPAWSGQRGFGPGPGRRFRRGAFVVLLVVVLLVAALATVVASAATGNAPAPWITVLVAAAVTAGRQARSARPASARPANANPTSVAPVNQPAAANGAASRCANTSAPASRIAARTPNIRMP